LIGVVWGALLTLALLRAPEAETAPRDGVDARAPNRFRLRDTVPRLSDYIACFALIAIPAVATTMAIIFLRTATNGVQFSLYVVYLDGIGMTGTTIGILFAAIEITSGLGSLFAGRAMRLGDPQRTVRPIIPATSHHQLTAIELQLGISCGAGAPIQPCLT